MTRKEQIEKEAHLMIEGTRIAPAHIGSIGDSSPVIDAHKFGMFIAGAEWADANPDQLTYELADKMKMYRNKCKGLEHDHKIMKEALRSLCDYQFGITDHTGALVIQHCVEALSKLKVKE